MPPVRLATFVFLLGIAACGVEQPDTWHVEEGYRWRELAVKGSRSGGFRAMSSRRTGVDFGNRLDPATARAHDHLLIGSGVAVGDVDGDGLPDLYFARLEGENALYRNLGGWRFEDITAQAGVAAPGRYSTGASFADVDGDGRLDLFVTALGGPNALYRNLGDGRFQEVTHEAGLASRLGSTTATWADVEGDGDLDLYVAAYKVESAADVLRPYEQPGMELVVQGPDGAEIAPAYRNHFRMEERDGRLVAVEQADPDRLYLNDGTGRFMPVPWTDGTFLDEDGRPLPRDVDDFGLAAAFADVDGDGDADLYVCNDFDDPDHFWINQGDGTFRAAPWYALRTTSHASMAVDFSDLDRDGDVDFFVADMLASDPERRLAQIPLHGPVTKPPERWRHRLQFGRNTLFLNRGDGTWAQVAEAAGVDGSDWTWGSVFADVDLDGYEDLLVVNGHGRDMRDGDAYERISSLRGAMTWNDAKTLYPDLPTLNRAFRNRGDGTFEDVTERWGFAVDPDVAHGIATGDLDGDGDLDVVLNRLNAEARLLRNESEAPRLAVRLAGRAPNTQGIGARVRLSGGALPVQEKEVRAGGLYLSSADPVVSFALGPGEGSRTLEVFWPSGATSKISVWPDRLYVVEEPEAVAGEGGADSASGDAAADAERRLRFQDVSYLLAHEHHDSDFDPWVRQPLLPYDPGRLGPGVTWTDVDDDGRSDLLVAAGQGSSRGVFVNRGGSFERVPAAVVGHDETTLLPAAGAAGTLLVGRTSFDASGPAEARALAGVVRSGTPDGGEGEVVAGPHLSSVGPLAQADVDGDGDLDLFVGGRTVPAFYPLPATSRLLLRQEGGYVEAPGSDDAFRDVGMVSGAVFSDLDGDGDPDLALAVEWGAVRIFVNEGGRFRDGSAAWGTAALTGLWRGVTAGDLNGDGRMDLVATNQGRNTRLQSSADRPLTLVHGDVDQNGVWEVVPARARRSGGPIYPLVRYEQLRAAVPGVRARASSFAAYARATVEEVLGVPLGDVFAARVTTLDHTVFLNEGGRFRVRALPFDAQLAPAQHAGVADLDADGHEDIFLTQNFFPTDPFTPRYDAGRGLVLLGDGAGGFSLPPDPAYGLAAYGDQRGGAFADFDGDGRLDIVIGQHGGPTLLFRNVSAARGLRVRLVGPPGNPDAVGARVRLRYRDGSAGPTREIHSGAGYWSVDDPVQVLGRGGAVAAVEVRWPDGTEARVPVEEDRTELTVRWGDTR